MALTIPKNEGGTFELCPEGNHVACCYAVIDLGTHEESYEGQPPKPKRKIFVQWEISSEARQDGTAFRIGKTYTLSSHEKSTMRKDFESWRGQKFTEEDLGNFRLQNLIGKACMLNVVQSEREGKTNSKITTIARMPKGMPVPSLSEDPLFVSLETDEFDHAAYDRLPDRLKDQIVESPEWGTLITGNRKVADEVVDDIPF
jgi:hypothetical protein